MHPPVSCCCGLSHLVKYHFVLVRGRGVDCDMNRILLRFFAPALVLFLMVKLEFGFYKAGQPCKVYLLVPVCLGWAVGGVLLQHALFSQLVVPMSVCPAPTHPPSAGSLTLAGASWNLALLPGRRLHWAVVFGQRALWLLGKECAGWSRRLAPRAHSSWGCRCSYLQRCE